MNISSAVVHARPGHAEAVRGLLGELPGVEVHVETPEGKFIVTLESDTDADTIATYERVSTLDGVMSAAMVYHHSESNPEEVV